VKTVKQRHETTAAYVAKQFHLFFWNTLVQYGAFPTTLPGQLLKNAHRKATLPNESFIFIAILH
jgi:hypothetical protein